MESLIGQIGLWRIQVGLESVKFLTNPCEIVRDRLGDLILTSASPFDALKRYTQVERVNVIQRNFKEEKHYVALHHTEADFPAHSSDGQVPVLRRQQM